MDTHFPMHSLVAGEVWLGQQRLLGQGFGGIGVINMEFEWSKAMDTAQKIVGMIDDVCIKAEIVGSIRRGKQKVHDIDIVAIPKLFPGMVIQRLEGKCEIGKKGNKIVTGTLDNIPFDIYFATPKTFETLVLIRTGSKEHNIKLCKLAKEKGWKLKADGTGLIDANNKLIDNTEAGILEKLVGHYVEPKDREVNYGF